MWVTPDDVRDRWVGGDLDFTDQTIATLIGDAEDAIRASVPDIDQMVDTKIPLARVSRVISRMVIRVLRNPEGIRTLQETTGQFSGSTTYAGDVLGEIVFTDEDRRDLLGKGPTGRRAYSVMPGGIR
ncbi:Gp19/Gp15/Gp42 family protein [Brachybacterium halotolerans subsp. kimchii]|uniref:Gp19/Gp15/Gp42 family protein n=1 Tax=Brachybacterium halotolerans TaxID=2795215 RepID=UPI001E402D4A|nr:Gp19/Gp15/Gp42 family protein [Brachybacterium halotolerans]UEJ84008.1 Gp19/Gp15/Gp42 family protein [Brachybacterium halotolerans subsp. kimchii]